MAGIGELSVSVTARTNKAMQNIRSFRASINRLPGAISAAARSMGGMAAAAAGLVGVGAIGNEIRKSFGNIDDIAKTSDKIGIATEKLSALRFAAEETGAGTSALDTGLEQMQRRVSDAASGSGEAAGALKELGIEAVRLNSLSADEKFKTIAESLGGVSNQADKARLSYDLFGRGGVDLLNTLRLGRQGLSDYEKEAEKLGITVSRFEASQIESANDAFGRIGKSIEGITNRLAIGLAPVIESVSKSLTEWGTSGQTSTKQISGGIKKIAVGVGFVRDGIEFWIRAFKSVRAYVTEFFAWMVGKVQTLAQLIADTLNKIPGVKAEPLEFTGIFADELKKEAEKARKAADDAWRKPLPSEGIKKFFDEMDSKIRESKKKFDESVAAKAAADNANLAMGGAASGIGGMIGNLAGSIAGVSKAAAGNIATALQANPLRVELAQTAQKGSREEFQLMRQMQSQQANKVAQAAKEQTSIMTGVKSGIDKLSKLFESSNTKLDEVASALQNLDMGEAV